ncbi:hypothetical protein AJ80_03312 [Polytolypa hystricis UAMH7299]|uniref:Bifunctional cytochrome P450/NADPH--P450 reductase n=1 Tax=Polytolypa hystricis (strain UAMH7299) TaxID=1447883 RepID=A0A2B7YJC1_POLH7|nr:hypothetical protein AJ80_03312 [Polytolypa hystricis UAMH7299]
MAATETMACPVHLDSEDELPTMNGVETMACPAHSGKENGLPTTNGTAKMNGIATTEEEIIDQSNLLKIPSPPHAHYFGLLGHAPDLDRMLPVRSYWRLMDEYSPIFQLDLGMTYPRVFVGSRDLVNEMADDNRFTKYTHKLHREMRAVFGDGLFSAASTDKAWWKAHRLLIPAFGPIGMKKMFDDMQDLSAQLVLKWDRYGPEHEIECIEDMSRLTFDTIGLCAFGYRFNEFYMEDPHPFQKQLKESIVESGKRANRPDLLNYFYYKDEQHRQENITKMRELCRKIIQDRLENPQPDAKDLLNVMLNGVDRETGEKLGVENVIYQIPTLLGGGYETTGSTLSFIYYYLCSNPEALRKAQQEVDEVVGEKVVSYDMLQKLKYLDAVMKEALRLQHPASLLTRFSTKDTVMGGKYFIRKGQMVSGIWRHFHRDPEVWGEDADEFRPERMLDGNFQKMPPNSWKPFGDGLRACIGRGFAEQEILINLAMVLQRFHVSKVDPNYEMQLRGQMGVKPIDFKIKVRRRSGRSLLVGIPGGGTSEQQEKASQSQQQSQRQQQNGVATAHKVKKPVSVFFGGNQGTSESLVQALSRSAPEFGLDMSDIRDLDDVVGNLPIDRPCVIITPSYEGRPPDNGKKFVAWIEKMAAQGEKLPAGIKFAVFGVGNSDWVHTFHRIPILVDETLVQLGAERILEAGFANVKRDLIGPWEAWSEKLCMTLSGTTKQEHPDRIGVDVHIESNSLNIPSQVLPGERMDIGVVIANRELADTSVGAAKRHVDVRLPAGCKYRTGDYLVVQGRNSDETVFRVMKRFGLSAEDVMSVQSSKKDFLPIQPMAVEHFLRSNVELATPITTRQLATLASWAEETSTESTKLEKMQDDVVYQQLLDKRYSAIDVLEEVPQLRLPFGVYIDLLLPLSPRVYSISSSPLEPANKSKDCLIASVTFDVLRAPATSGHGTFNGVASTYLTSRRPGDSIACLIRATKVPFHLPPDTETPIIMFAAGSGIAPMRAFIQERAVIKRAGVRKLGPALLFFGCRHPDKDYMYRSELTAWESEGLVEIIPCFSKPGGGQKGRYVSDALWEHRDRIWDLFLDGANIYTCGSAARVGRSSAAALRQIWMEKTGKSEPEAHEWLDQVKNIRYVSDVY